ncbi:MAG: hypothetical protein IK078_06120 [Lachnospiraceae bacterium]|nr:hypothetical protein [Lachnospiraceae bacterium]
MEFAKAIYGLKLDDQYWGLYLVSILILFYCAFRWKSVGGDGQTARMMNEKNVGVTDDRKVSSRLLFITATYCILSFFPFFLGKLYDLTAGIFPESYRYEELSHIWLYPLILPLALGIAVSFASKVEDVQLSVKPDGKTDGKEKSLYDRLLPAFLIGILILVFCWAGNPLTIFRDAKETVKENGYGAFFTKEESGAFDLILSDADVIGAGDITIWGSREMMAKSRTYDARLMPVYGKDIVIHPEKYSQEIETFAANYDLYEAKADHVGSKADAIGVIANTPNLYEGVACDYVVIYDPASQGADVDADGIFSETGYRKVGQSGRYLIYSRIL